MEDIIQLHINNKYYVHVAKTKNGCIANFPPNYLIQPAIGNKFVKYIITDEGFDYTINDNEINNYKIDKYAARLGILTDILIKTIELGIPNKLIYITDGTNTFTSLLKILPAPLDEVDINKEKLLAQVFSDIMIGLFDSTSANKLGVNRGYQSLGHLLEMGGLI